MPPSYRSMAKAAHKAASKAASKETVTKKRVYVKKALPLAVSRFTLNGAEVVIYGKADTVSIQDGGLFIK